MEIGIVGPGRVGASMACRLARGGARVLAYDRERAKRDALADEERVESADGLSRRSLHVSRASGSFSRCCRPAMRPEPRTASGRRRSRRETAIRVDVAQSPESCVEAIICALRPEPATLRRADR